MNLADRSFHWLSVAKQPGVKLSRVVATTTTEWNCPKYRPAFSNLPSLNKQNENFLLNSYFTPYNLGKKIDFRVEHLTLN